MANKFVKGNTYVFSRKKFRKSGLRANGWDKAINGQEVIITSYNVGYIGLYRIHPGWCKCIKVGDGR